MSDRTFHARYGCWFAGGLALVIDIFLMSLVASALPKPKLVPIGDLIISGAPIRCSVVGCSRPAIRIREDLRDRLVADRNVSIPEGYHAFYCDIHAPDGADNPMVILAGIVALVVIYCAIAALLRVR